MSTKTALKKAVNMIGLTPMSHKLDVTYQAINGWIDRNRMPDTEYSGRTQYAVKIQKMTDGKVTVSKILGHVPVAAQRYANENSIYVN